MIKRNLPPVHPGEILKEEYILERGLTITEVAVGLGISRSTLSAVVNEQARITPELAVKLSEAFGNTSQFWINLQRNYELWHAEKNVDRSRIRHFNKGRNLQSA
ncbi:HigA family addiction module antitoxin [Dyadobacter pollutisoli]|uniref:HigA family addiction module antitoxin n=1 Tax=Dyadobacter pollutisoli TaxID=2910158 RepID=A0A9E8N452_9BACT|nr:HigA family addiction module antitoxin [Dyadobacter pollutisoli]WAC09400.1 HigA family addiction module antitoxin [Dyadobacter pollutisoli]